MSAAAKTKQVQEHVVGIYHTLRDYIQQGDLLHRTAAISIITFTGGILLLPVLMLIDSVLFDRMFAYFVAASAAAVFGSLALVLLQDWLLSDSAEDAHHWLSTFGIWNRLATHVTRGRSLVLVYFVLAPFVGGLGGYIAASVVTAVASAWFFYEIGREHGEETQAGA